MLAVITDASRRGAYSVLCRSGGTCSVSLQQSGPKSPQRYRREVKMGALTPPTVDNLLEGSGAELALLNESNNDR